MTPRPAPFPLIVGAFMLLFLGLITREPACSIGAIVLFSIAWHENTKP